MRRRVSWAPLLLVTLLAGVTFAYLIEARGVSLSPQNLLLLQPTAWLVLFLWAVLAIGYLRTPAQLEEGPAESWPDVGRVVAMVAAFGGFILALEPLGYDIAIWGFTLIALIIGGERNKIALAIFPLVFSLAIVTGFRLLVPYPFPTSLL
ncbi:tripartite tricarboxylate transporter TctB family protein [Falsiroseomonas sp. E2-1-a4]|uniref:tripartite tricarboxylate transporter TctB family protein n=1 Tax=Falsiroseomonas sp. E2-1-a4 TaxID=3239299 RepID=UPI003F2ED941